jgi:diguanylate cyclase (GGDEF)-like protein
MNMAVTAALAVSLGFAAYLLGVTVLRCRSEKKNYFILCVASILVCLIGTFMELTASNTNGALTGVKVMYAGACFIYPLFLMFLSQYCEYSIPTAVKYALTAVAVANVVLVWTTDQTHLVYRDYAFNTNFAVRNLLILEQGPFYYSTYAIGGICIVFSVVLIISRLRKWEKSYRKPLLIFLFAALAPFLTSALYISASFVTKTNPYGINLTPFALIAANFLLYMGILRYDLFDFTSRAQSVSLDMIRDGFIFLDNNLHYSASNKIARALFPDLEHLGKGVPITEVSNWPKGLTGLDASLEYRDVRFSLTPCGEESERVFNAWVRRVETERQPLGLIVLIQDITENTCLMQQLEEAAYRDGLTGLYNRRYFMEHAARELDRAHRMQASTALIMLDLDHFKRTNDVYGHSAGDEVLRCVSKQLQGGIRAYDIAARYGGEEFVVLLANSDLQVGATLAERLRKKIEETNCSFDGEKHSVTGSFGVAETKDGADSLADLICRADAALYRAKQDGRNQVRTE